MEPIGGIDHVQLDREVTGQKIGWIIAVGHDPADFCCGQKHIGRARARKQGIHGGAIGQVNLGPARAHDLTVSISCQSTHDRATNQAARPCNKN